jgi:hypothetical protein
MTPYAGDKTAQRKVADSAAVLSGQVLPGNLDGRAVDQEILVIKAWAGEGKSYVEFWRGYLTGERDEPIDLIELSGLMTTVRNLRIGLYKYLFGPDAKLNNVDRQAWEGVQRNRILIELNYKGFWDEVLNYHDWLTEMERTDSYPVSRMDQRAMVRQKRKDTREIAETYDKFAEHLLPVLEEIIEYS